MENRILIIGDELFGDQGEVASRCAEMLLCRCPNRPMQFSINAPTPLSIPQLIARASSDIIGKRAGRIVLGLGLGDLLKEHGDGRKTVENYGSLVHELVNKTLASIFVVTVPAELLPDAFDQISLINEALRGFVSQYPQRVNVFDFAAHADFFLKKQLERGKFARSLYSEDSKPTSLCVTLQSMFLQDCILKEIEDNKEMK